MILYIFIVIIIIIILLIVYFNQLIKNDQFKNYENLKFPIDAVITFRGEIFNLNNVREGYNYEIKYCLRSICKNMPWIRRIYILQGSNAPIPSFFSENYMVNNIYIYNQDTIIPYKYLPTTNSNSIETFITSLPGLSEHFIYFNDDWFVMKYVGPDYFFDHKGNPKRVKIHRKYIETNKIKAPPSPGENVWYPHIPTPYTKNEIDNYINLYPDFVHKIRQIKSRNNLDLSKKICYDIGLTFPCMQLHMSIDYLNHLDNGETEKIASDYYEFPKDIYKIKNSKKKFVCMNDGFEGSLQERENYRNEFKHTMEILFPEKSRAEI